MKRNRKSVQISHKSYDLAGLPKSYFNPGEIETLITLIASVEPKTVIEFGCNNGRTAVAVLRNVPSIKRYVGIDVLHGYQTVMPVQRREIPNIPGEMALPDARFELIALKNGSFDLKSGDLPKADAIFIDADHSRRGVENDYSLAKKAINKGGIIIFHDDNCLPSVEVTQTINDFVQYGADIQHIAGTWLSFERF